MEDSRGILRGSCKNCACDRYTRPEGGVTMKCVCGHPPGIHAKLQKSDSASQSITGHKETVVPYQTIKKSDLDSAKEDGTELATYPTGGIPSLSVSRVQSISGSSSPIVRMRSTLPRMRDGHHQGVSQVQRLGDDWTGSLQLSDIPGAHFEEAWPQSEDKFSGNVIGGHVLKDEDIPEHLRCIGCGKKEKYQREDGSYFNYCGRSCSEQFHPKAISADQPLCPNCGRHCTYKKQDGTYHDYCGETCRDAHLQVKPSLIMPPIGIDGTTSSGSISLYQQDEAKCRTLFQSMWARAKGPVPTVEHVFTIQNPILLSQFNSYKKRIGLTTVEEHFHGTSISCDLAKTQSLCSNSKCSICNISKCGFNSSLIGSNVTLQRFGSGFYLAPNSSKCHDYTQGCHLSGHRALLLCEVCPGNKYRTKIGDSKLRAPPKGYQCVYGDVGQDLNYSEIVMYDCQSILPRYILLYKLNGTKKLVS